MGPVPRAFRSPVTDLVHRGGMTSTRRPSDEAMGFVHLHNHTEFSILDGMGRISHLVDAAADAQMPAVAMTDHGTLGGVWKFANACRTAGIKPIIGLEAYLAIGGDRFNPKHLFVPREADPDAGDEGGADAEGGSDPVRPDPYSAQWRRGLRWQEVDPPAEGQKAPKTPSGMKRKSYEHLTLLATTEQGYTNLLRLHNESQKSKQGKHPLIDYDLLAQYGEGLVVLTGCLAGPLAGALVRGDVEGAERNVASLIEAVGRENVYVEVMDHGIDVERGLIDELCSFAAAHDLPTVVTNDCHFVEDGHHEAHDAWLACQTKAKMSDPNRWSFNGWGYHLRTADEMERVGRDLVADLILRRLGIELDGTTAGAKCRRLAGRIVQTVTASGRRFDLSSRPGAVDLFDELDGVEVITDAVTDGTGTGVPAYLKRTRPRGAVVDDDDFTAMLAEVADDHERNIHRAWVEGMANTTAIADRCADWVLGEHEQRLPEFPRPAKFKSAKAYLADRVQQGIFERFGPEDSMPADERARITDRVASEFKVICDMGFADYFLIVQDMVSWARSDRGLPTPEYPDGVPGGKRPIIVGPGRGSAAGSMCSFVLGIVDVDPLRYDLLFERFLEPGREGMPDIDLDFEQVRVEEVRAYLRARYGFDNVARIGSFGVSKTRKSIQQAGSVLELRSLADQLTPLVPVNQGNPASFEQLLDPEDGSTAPFRAKLAALGEKAQHLVDLAQTFENTVNSKGIHACGVLVCGQPLTDLIPLRKERTDIYKHLPWDEIPWVTEWEGVDVDKAGFLKVDTLSIRNLDIAALAIEMISETTGEHIDPRNLPDPDDPTDPRTAKAYEYLSTGRTESVFQMESQGMTELVEEVNPTCLDDISAASALYRPGPRLAGMDTRYALRAQGREEQGCAYLTGDPTEREWLESVLGVTYGVLVYQEQVMRLGTVVGGFTVAERSVLRKAVGKKNPVLMAEMKQKFLDGAAREFRDDAGELISPEFSSDTAKRLWTVIEGCGKYLFNKSHSIAYGQVTFLTAFLKANWPTHFGAAALVTTDNAERRLAVLRSLADEGIEVLPPDINDGDISTSMAGPTSIRLGLSEVKDVGKASALIVAERESGGPFTSAAEVLERVKETVIDPRTGKPKTRALTTTVVESLIASGAMDCFGPRLGQMMTFRRLEDRLCLEAEWGPLELAARQRGRLGVSVGVHPAAHFKADLKAFRPGEVIDSYGRKMGSRPIPVHRVLALTEDNTPVTTLGLLTSWAQKPYKKGMMGVFTVEASNGDTVECTMWNNELAPLLANEAIPPVGSLVSVTGRTKRKEAWRGNADDEDDEDTNEPVVHTTVFASFIEPIDVDDSPVTPPDVIGDPLVLTPPDDPEPEGAGSGDPEPGEDGPEDDAEDDLESASSLEPVEPMPVEVEPKTSTRSVTRPAARKQKPAPSTMRVFLSMGESITDPVDLRGTWSKVADTCSDPARNRWQDARRHAMVAPVSGHGYVLRAATRGGSEHALMVVAPGWNPRKVHVDPDVVVESTADLVWAEVDSTGWEVATKEGQTPVALDDLVNILEDSSHSVG